MADVLGGFQPDTKSPSARRADFDLRRLIAKAESSGPPEVTQAELDAVRWNSAWGVVATSAQPGNVNVLAPATNVRLTADVTFAALTGRRYRLTYRVASAFSSAGAPTFGIAVNVLDGANALVGDADQWLWVGGNYAGGVLQSFLNGDGASRTVRATCGLVNAAAGAQVTIAGKQLVVEDIGPITPTPMALPAPPVLAAFEARLAILEARNAAAVAALTYTPPNGVNARVAALEARIVAARQALMS